MDEQSVAPGSAQLAAGVGNEALAAVACLLLLVCSLLGLLIHWRWQTSGPPRAQTIHGSQAQLVAQERLRQQQAGTSPAAFRRSFDASGERPVCPICLTPCRYMVETNCGHWFCAPCVLDYWRHGGGLGLSPVNCPCCRQAVTVLFPEFSSSEEDSALTQHAGENGDEATIQRTGVSEYNRRYGGSPRSFRDLVFDAPVLLRRALDTMLSGGRGIRVLVRLRFYLTMLLALVYCLSPYDFLPEATLGILGIADDVLLFLAALLTVSAVYRDAYLATQHASGHQHTD
eukprot:TRINITY_DN37843_c0_g1_i1.p1 TRINITY_DN37843_c0_g1~~TRINITY_DN37843_c0_g1_i1.p1  ORF type:complete len:286 (-),score=43.84 TRINITY_DN37843_c0_g1_i1:230-1087(-)